MNPSGEFLRPVFPPEFYLSHNGEPFGRFKAVDFMPYDTDYPPDKGALVVQYPHERPFILRVTKQEGNQIWTKDGTGAEFVYDITPIDQSTRT